jgi:DNA polymerase-3 subunit gamma/tau
MKAVENQNAADGLHLINELLQEGYDIQEFLVGLTEHLRNLYVAQNSKTLYLVEASDAIKKRYSKASDAFVEDDLMRMLHIVSEAQFKVKEAHQPKIQFEITLLKLIHMGRSKKLNTLIKELNGLKKKAVPEKEVTKSPPAQKNESSPEQDENKEQKSPKILNPAANSNHQPQSTSDTEEKTEPAEPVSTANGKKTENLSAKIFDEPTLGNGSHSINQATTALPANEVKEPEFTSQKITLSLIKEKWEPYLLSLKKEVPKMIYFQMQRVEPVKLENRELLLQCTDHFAQKMVEEHRQALEKILKAIMGGFLQLRCVVNKEDAKAKAVMSPYERFKKLQERDPKIKTLVELFGAELNYNLNR